MSTRLIARKELRRHGTSTVALFFCVALVLLGAAALVPRSWTAKAVIGLDPDPTAMAALGARLQAAIREAAGDAPVTVEPEGERLRLRYAADRPQRALEGLNAVLARVVKGELERLREGYEADEHRLVVQLDEAAARVDALAAELAAGRSGLPAGGESALGARIGQLEGERDALQLDLRASAELRKRLAAQVAALDAEIAALEVVTGDGAPAARVRIDTELKPPRAAAAVRLATLRDEISVKERRLREIGGLLQGASAQTSVLQKESEALRELQRRYEDAAAEHRQMRLRVQEIRDRIALNVTVSALPFRVLSAPLPPDSPDGVPAWIWALGALAGAALVAAGRLLGSVLVDDRVRLAEQIVVDAELPVLAVIAEHTPVQVSGRVRWPVIGMVLLGALTGAGVLVFLVVFG